MPRQSAAGASPFAPGKTSSYFRGSAAFPAGPIQLQVRRLGNAVELVVQGVGAGPQLQQSSRANGWQGQLTTASPSGLRAGPQRLSLPELGLQSVSLDGSGSSYNLSVRPMPGISMASPVVSADGVNLILTFPASPQASLQTNRLDLSQPGALPLPTYAPPLQARAVAPPLGDMAVGSMVIRNRSFLNLRGPEITMKTRGASARDVLQRLADIGRYSFTYVETYEVQEQGALQSDINSNSNLQAAPREERGSSGNANFQSQSSIRTEFQSDKKQILEPSPPVTVSFVNEKFARAFNFVLLAAGLEGRLEGNAILVGKKVAFKTIGPSTSKVYRLNQVSSSSAADYLANLGASVTKTNTITTAVTQGGNQSQPSGAPNSATTFSSTQTAVEAYGASSGPLVGLIATTDSRLGTITLVGDSAVVAIAEQYLRQLDLRQRQVALSVKILDVNLDNDSTMENSFAIRWGNNFIVNDGGELLGAFGNNLPPTYNPLTGFSATQVNPGTAYPKDQFYDFLRAQIVSQSTKLLASPTLILQENPAELRSGDGVSAGGGAASGSLDDYSIDSPIGRRRGNEGVVRVGTNVITQYKVSNAANSSGGSGASASNVITCEPTLSTAGLVLGARVEKIDDNGFVTFALSPSVSAVTDRNPVPGCGNIDILSIRRLDTGALRVRDGQTLIMTGVISDFDRAEVSKWPILGDIPLIGSLFRSSGNKREKRELVIMVTPKIINDVEGGVYGYGYQPSTPQAREFMGSASY